MSGQLMSYLKKQITLLERCKMKWYKHKTGSHDDPDISDAWDRFGESAYNVFFILLEIYGEEYNHRDQENYIIFSQRFVARKLRKRWTKVEPILNYYQTKNRLSYFLVEKSIRLRVEDFVDITSNWTKRKNKQPTEAPTEAPTAIDSDTDTDTDIYNTYSLSNNSKGSYKDNNSLIADDLTLVYGPGVQESDLDEDEQKLLSYFQQNRIHVIAENGEAEWQTWHDAIKHPLSIIRLICKRYKDLKCKGEDCDESIVNTLKNIEQRHINDPILRPWPTLQTWLNGNLKKYQANKKRAASYER